MTVEELLISASNQIEIITAIYSDLDERIKKRVADLQSAIDGEEEAVKVFKANENVRQNNIEALKSERNTLNEAIEPLRKEKVDLDKEIDALLAKKADIKIENAQLSESNAKFKTYEEKAWKILGAKEGELLEREKAVEEKEALRPRSKTLLPPIDE